MAQNDPVPDPDHVLRFASYNRVHRHEETDLPLSLLPQAFTLRENEGYLSVTWVEYFGAFENTRIQQAIQAFRANHSTPPKSCFGLAQVRAIKQVCSQRGANVRVLHEPDGNPAHVAIRRYPRDNNELFEALAAEVFSTIVRNVDIPPG